MRELCEFRIYPSCFISNMNTSFYFDSIDLQNSYFDSFTDTVSFSTNFNYIRDRSTVKVPAYYYDIAKARYGMFICDGKRYYFNIVRSTYLNDEVTLIEFAIDPFATFLFDGNGLFNNMVNAKIERTSLSLNDFNNKKLNLLNNDDVPFNSEYQCIGHKFHQFIDLQVLFSASVLLCDEDGANFGDIDAPDMQSSTGGIVNKIVGATQLYYCSIAQFISVLKKLSPYPWITQNIKTNSILPLDMLGTLQGTEKNILGSSVFALDEDSTSINIWYNDLDYTISDMRNLLSIDPSGKEDYLLRGDYIHFEITDYLGNSLLINPEDVIINGRLRIGSVITAGYRNEIKIFVEGLNNLYDKSDNILNGHYLNTSFSFNDFDTVPIAFDGYAMTMANSAYQRQLTKNRTNQGRIGQGVIGASDVVGIATGQKGGSLIDAGQSLIANSLSLTSKINISGNSGPEVAMNMMKSIGDMVVSDYDTYRGIQAQTNQAKIYSTNITPQSTNNASAIANDYYGITVKVWACDPETLNKARTYYKRFGFAVNGIENVKHANNQYADFYKLDLTSSTFPYIDNALRPSLLGRFMVGMTIFNNPTPTVDYLSDGTWLGANNMQ